MGINYNVRVQKHSSGIKELGQYGEMSVGSAAILRQQKQAVMENSIAVQRDIDTKINNERTKQVNEAIVRKGMMENIIFENINKIHTEGKEEIFKQMIFESFYNGLVLDDEFKAQNTHSIKAYSDSYIDTRGGYRMLKEAYNMNRSNIVLKNMVDVCEKSSRCNANKKIKEAKESSDVESIVFNLSEEEKEEIRYNADLGIDQVSSIVRDKVKNVIMSEKDRQADEEELLSELESAEESALMHKNIIEETTLFNALMRNIYKEYLMEKSGCKSTKEGCKSAQEACKSTKEACGNKTTEGCKTTKEGCGNKTTEGCKTTKEGCKSAQEACKSTKEGCKSAQEACKKKTTEACKSSKESNIEDTVIDMDTILAEAITQYTMMEVMNTLCLETFDVTKIKKMAHDLLYK